MSNIDATAMLELHGLKEPEIFGDIRATCARAQPKWSRPSGLPLGNFKGGRKIYYGTHRGSGPPRAAVGAMKMQTTSDMLDVISGLLGLVLVGCGAWYWYNSNVQALGTKQIAETAVLEIRETAECHMEAFKMWPGSTEAALEIQAEFMGLCMAAREYVFLPDCTERMREGDRAWNLSYKFNSICWGKN